MSNEEDFSNFVLMHAMGEHCRAIGLGHRQRCAPGIAWSQIGNAEAQSSRLFRDTCHFAIRQDRGIIYVLSMTEQLPSIRFIRDHIRTKRYRLTRHATTIRLERGITIAELEQALLNDVVDRCDLCGGELKPGKTTLEIWRGEELLIIRDIPADVCQQCDEAYISADVSKRLDHFLEEYHQHRPERYLAVPQYSAVQVMGG